MKGKEIIELINNNNLIDFKIGVLFNNDSLDLIELGDIGHSDRVAYIEGELNDLYSNESMNGGNLVDLIEENELSDFEIKVLFHDGTYNVFMNLQSLELVELMEIKNDDNLAVIKAKLSER